MGEAKLLRAIEHMKSGQIQPAAALLREALADPELDARGRAVACIWLAETQEDLDFKINCLQQAQRHEPGNQQVQQKLAELLARQQSRGGSDRKNGGSAHGKAACQPAQARPGLRLSQAPLVLGIDGGRNGRGSGIFVNGAGLVATSAYTVGNALQISVAYGGEQAMPGRVMRRFPTSDLALIQTSATLDKLDKLGGRQLAIADEAVTAMAYDGGKLRGVASDADESARRGWLRTSILSAMLPDAGGNPLYDSRGHALALLTRNVKQDTGEAWAISLAHVLSLAEQAMQEVRLLRRARLCRACGSRAQASQYGGRYCETCGARLPAPAAPNADAPDFERLAQIYGENQSRACPHCAAQVGYYGGRCLRCGHAPSIDMKRK